MPTVAEFLGRMPAAAGKSAGLYATKHVAHNSIVNASDRIGKGTHHGDRPIGGGMYEKSGTGTTLNGDRPVGGGMFEVRHWIA